MADKLYLWQHYIIDRHGQPVRRQLGWMMDEEVAAKWAQQNGYALEKVPNSEKSRQAQEQGSPDAGPRPLMPDL
jgi:hypothetical protein